MRDETEGTVDHITRCELRDTVFESVSGLKKKATETDSREKEPSKGVVK